MRRASALLLVLATLLALGGCASVETPAPAAQVDAGGDFIILAIAEDTALRPAAGRAVRADYRQAASYSGSDTARDTAAALATQHGLQQLDAWTIRPLNWYCLLLRLPATADRGAVLARLSADPRVALAQPLNEFQTLSAPAPYNDPYVALQTGFASIGAAGAQQQSRGERVTVAVIDTAIDQTHPDLRDQGLRARDFVGAATTGEHHGTEVAGIIAAAANNGIGIVGVAPGVRLLSLRACWGGAQGQAARCNSFTLAQALAAAIAAPADVINLSLGGPRDPLLEKLLAHALAQGIVVVGATPAGGRRDGFPTAVPGVLAVASREDGPAAPGVLAAPGLRILTLAPGGGYDYASGSSLAAAHASGTVALLRALDGRLDAAAMQALLNAAGAPLDACRAVQRLRPQLSCAGWP